MRIGKPTYYDGFRCLAGECPDSCCKEWTVSVDPDTAEKYRALPGPLGETLREILAKGDALFAEGDACPLWRPDGLCQVQTELGEEGLCRVCREFPRLRHDYGDFVELGLDLSCPEAARLIMNAPGEPYRWEEVPGGRAPEYDGQGMALLRRARKAVLEFLKDLRYDVGQALAAILLYSYQVDEALSFPEDFPETLDPERYLSAAKKLPKTGNMEGIFTFYENLEILTPAWREMLASGPKGNPWQEAFRPLARYFVERYYLQAVSDLDLASRVKWIAVSCLLIRALGGPVPETARLYSKEIENDADNMDALLDAAFTEPAFTDTNILSLLLTGGR